MVSILSSYLNVYSLKSFIFIAGNVLVECNKTNLSTSPLQNTTKTPSQLNETTNTYVTTAHHISETTTKEEHNNGLIMNHGSSDHNSLCRLFHTVPWKLRNSSDFFMIFCFRCFAKLFYSYVLLWIFIPF